jgi:hypothetical protein
MKYMMMTLMGWIAFTLTPLSAQTSPLRTGLWEYATSIKTQSGEMEKAMAQMEHQLSSLPPEQRKMMEQNMASYGVAKTAKPNTYRVCITPENAARSYLPPSQGEQCSYKILKQTPKFLHFTYHCKGSHSSSGEGEYTFIGNTAYKGKLTSKTTAEGRTETVQMNISGKWISNDCKQLGKR